MAADLAVQLARAAEDKLAAIGGGDSGGDDGSGAAVVLRPLAGGHLGRLRALGGAEFAAVAGRAVEQLGCERGRAAQLEVRSERLSPPSSRFNRSVPSQLGLFCQVLSAACCAGRSSLSWTWAASLLVSCFAAVGTVGHQLGRRSLRREGGEPCGCSCGCGGACHCDLGIRRTCRAIVAWHKRRRMARIGPPEGHD